MKLGSWLIGRMDSFNHRSFSMLIHFDFELADLRSSDPSLRDEALRGLLRAHRLGDHVVVISREICRYLRVAADLSNAERATLERIGLEFTQRAELPRKAPKYIRVSAARSLPGEERAIVVGFRELIESRILDRSVLLVENIRRDGLLYGELLKAHFDLHGCPPPAYEPMHGGGADLIGVFVEQIRRGRIVCGIVDTDRLSPASQAFTKRDAMRRIAAEMDWSFAFGFSPPCREAENCLPMNLIMDVQSGQANSSNTHFLRIAEREIAAAHDCTAAFWLFVDLKEGVSLGTISKLASVDDRSWLEAKLTLINFDLNQSSLQGYGAKVFDQLAAHGHHLSALRSLTRQSQWRAVFADFMESLVWIFAGGRRVAT